MRDIVMIGPVHPSPVRHYARALDEAERLQAFVTGYVYQPARPLERICSAADTLLKNRLSGILRRRTLADVNPQRCRRAPSIEALYQLGRRVPLLRRLEPFQHHWKHHALIDRFAA